ncbi:hypothetical protein [Bradyrhizobium vignae]|uniref:Uncharacterized protein n=1 Tax=Bradyrhizobium vignae TaxID=1549949 RepID=A0ABS3ZV97_9BRAD|nr:hypothetical protein [Bradyrhizobium vignae]MBP0111675.1 hypothetical protein [Bradyrhizobium vignae]
MRPVVLESIVSFVLRVGAGIDDVRSSITHEDRAGLPSGVLLLVGSTFLVGISFRAAIRRRFAMTQEDNVIQDLAWARRPAHL